MLRSAAIAAHPAFSRALWRELVIPALFVGAILTSNNVLTALPGVKLFDVLVFAAGFSLGLRRGATVAVAAWAVYGSANPWGMASVPLLAVLMASETLYAAAGVAARGLAGVGVARRTLVFAGAAVLATVAYDLATNAYTGLYWAGLAGGAETGRWLLVALLGPGALVFSAIHVTANLTLFPVVGPLAIAAARRLGSGR
ncbi:MAG: hypothetical protein VW450_04760 [Chloroflexota bacterium]